jgi:hypothetical protein
MRISYRTYYGVFYVEQTYPLLIWSADLFTIIGLSILLSAYHNVCL